jgi:hypothetical protein
MSNYMKNSFLFFFFAVLFFQSCEEPYLPPLSNDPPDIVVEGYIEAGDRPTPPYVLLTYTQPFYNSFNAEALSGLFVHDAEVVVRDGEKEVLLEEICLEDLSPAELLLFGEFLGVSLDSLPVNICVYIDRSLSMIGEAGKTYTLEIKADGRQLSAVTRIPNPVPLDSLKFVRPTQEAPAELRELRVFLSDPVEEVNFYRYLTKVNSEPFIPGFNSVLEDVLFNGQSFEFPMPKGEPRNETIDPRLFGFYSNGDTTTVKWCSIDKEQYDFWNTLEFNELNQGPFSSFTRIESNIEGGLGIWAGIGARYYTLNVQ